MVKKNGTIIRYYENGIQEHEWNYKDDVWMDLKYLIMKAEK